MASYLFINDAAAPLIYSKRRLLGFCLTVTGNDRRGQMIDRSRVRRVKLKNQCVERDIVLNCPSSVSNSEIFHSRFLRSRVYLHLDLERSQISYQNFYDFFFIFLWFEKSGKVLFDDYQIFFFFCSNSFVSSRDNKFHTTSWSNFYETFREIFFTIFLNLSLSYRIEELRGNYGILLINLKRKS